MKYIYFLIRSGGNISRTEEADMQKRVCLWCNSIDLHTRARVVKVPSAAWHGRLENKQFLSLHMGDSLIWGMSTTALSRLCCSIILMRLA